MFTLEEYIEYQITFLIEGAKGMKMANKETIIIWAMDSLFSQKSVKLGKRVFLK